MEIKYSHDVKNESYLETLHEYRIKVRALVEAGNFSEPESALATSTDDVMRSNVSAVKTKLGHISDVVVVGIGGSSLGVEAIHDALKKPDSPRLHVLDMVSDQVMEETLRALSNVPREQLAVCIISKSGGTTETMTNADVLLTALGSLYGEVPYERVVCIGDPDNDLLQFATTHQASVVPMQGVIGGRYSVFTAVGLVPLSLLGHDVDALLAGLVSVWQEANETAAATGASTLYTQLQAGVRTVNFFTFQSTLEKMGYWYRQLTAESLGKSADRDGNSVNIGYIPTISTPVELHSIGQLYFSGFPGVFTEFVSVTDQEMLYHVADQPVLAQAVAGKSMCEIAHAIENGVVAAYDDRQLPYRKTDWRSACETEVGLFMGQKMLETMYLANLMNVNAFDQPNVELYKQKTKEILHK